MPEGWISRVFFVFEIRLLVLFLYKTYQSHKWAELTGTKTCPISRPCPCLDLCPVNHFIKLKSLLQCLHWDPLGAILRAAQICSKRNAGHKALHNTSDTEQDRYQSSKWLSNCPNTIFHFSTHSFDLLWGKKKWNFSACIRNHMKAPVQRRNTHSLHAECLGFNPQHP